MVDVMSFHTIIPFFKPQRACIFYLQQPVKVHLDPMHSAFVFFFFLIKEYWISLFYIQQNFGMFPVTHTHTKLFFVFNSQINETTTPSNKLKSLMAQELSALALHKC